MHKMWIRVGLLLAAVVGSDCQCDDTLESAVPVLGKIIRYHEFVAGRTA